MRLARRFIPLFYRTALHRSRTSFAMSANTKTAARELHEGWTFAKVGGQEADEVKDGEWLEVRSFPTTVHVELLAHGRIPDPVRAPFAIFWKGR